MLVSTPQIPERSARSPSLTSGLAKEVSPFRFCQRPVSCVYKCTAARPNCTVLPRHGPLSTSQCACVNSDTSLLFLLVRLSSHLPVLYSAFSATELNPTIVMQLFITHHHHMKFCCSEQNNGWIILLHTMLYLDYR